MLLNGTVPPRKKNKYAVALGRRGGRKSGRSRMAKLTPEQRSEIGRRLAIARWSKYRAAKKTPCAFDAPRLAAIPNS